MALTFLRRGRQRERELLQREENNAVSQIFIVITFNGQKILRNVNVNVCRQVKRENSSLPVAVGVSKPHVLKAPVWGF